ncbi:MAG: DUF1294 domain-containing protein [Carnobacterium sp.]
MLPYLVGFVVVLNGYLFILMGLDKKKAQQHKWRIPEKRLLLLGLIGGGLGGLLGMYVFKHKTREVTFKLIYSIGTALLFSIIFYFLILN